MNDLSIEKIIQLRLQGKTLTRIGTEFNISGEYVRQLTIGIKPPPKYPIGIRRCYQCKKILPYSDFYISKSKNPTTNNRCKNCLKENSKKWAKIYLYKYKKGGIYFEHTRIRRKLYAAIKTGKIIKPNICEINKNCYGRIEAHHWLGYDKSTYLNIRWLCSKHHELADKKLL